MGRSQSGNKKNDIGRDLGTSISSKISSYFILHTLRYDRPVGVGNKQHVSRLGQSAASSLKDSVDDVEKGKAPPQEIVASLNISQQAECC